MGKKIRLKNGSQRLTMVWDESRGRPSGFMIKMLLVSVSSGEKPAGKGPEAGETVSAIDVMLDHVKRKIIKATEAPNCNCQQ